MISRKHCALILVLPVLAACSDSELKVSAGTTQWLAGDHHIHSRYSVGWNREVDPPTPILAGDAIYSTPMNVAMGRRFGLSWTVTTYHGGPNHSKVNFERAYPELLNSRLAIPEMIQFYGMELNTPGADHSSLIMPHTHDEADRLLEIESQFDSQEAWPTDPDRNTEDNMLRALSVMNGFTEKPLVIANHPSRSATDLGVYGRDEPAELRGWNDTAPEIATGMADSPGHQAAGLVARFAADGEKIPRGVYSFYPTLGGFDQMTAIVGGFWDSMLGEGRHWWITSNSDSHTHYSEGGIDFWPGEYSKTYVYGERSHYSIMDSLRKGKIFVTTGDLVSEVFVEASPRADSQTMASIGGTLEVKDGTEITVNIRVRDPSGNNHNSENPAVARVDLIMGEVNGRLSDPTIDRNESTQLIASFTSEDWQRDGELLSMSYSLPVSKAIYLRVRGTNTD